MTEENQELDLFAADLSEAQVPGNFVPAKSGVYALRIAQDGTEVRITDSGKLLVNIRYEFAEPDKVEKVGEGTIGGLFHKIFMSSAKGAGFVRQFVEGHGADWGNFCAKLREGQSLDINGRKTLLEQIYKQFEGSTCNAKVKYVSNYKNKEGQTVELTNPRNEIAGYVKRS